MKYLLLVENKLSGYDSYKTAGLFYKSHDGYLAVGVGVGYKQASVRYDKKDGKQPDPGIFNG